ncbi:MAG: hypothetical protein AB8B96_14345 [Lysobacterales bacterium]
MSLTTIPRFKLPRAACLTALVLILSSVSAQEQSQDFSEEMNPQQLLTVMFQAQKSGDFALMQQAGERLNWLRPQVGTYRYLLAKAYALQDKKSEAYNALLYMSKQGLTLDIKADEDLKNLRGTELFDFLAEELTKNAEQKGVVTRSITLNKQGLLADGLAFDPKTRQLLVGSITQGAVYRVSNDGKLEELVKATEENGLLGVFDIAVDAKSRSLWVSSAAVPHYQSIRFQDAGFSAIFQFDLDTGVIKRRFGLPNRDPGNKLVNLTVASDGKVYAANAARPEVYQIDVEKEQMSRIFTASSFTSIRGLAVSPDAKTLFFSDYEMGLFGVDLTTRKAHLVGAAATVNLGGIDSLSWYKDGLVAVQNGNLPHRVQRFVLDDEGKAVVAASSLLVNDETFFAPSEGVVVGDSFHLIANGNAPLYNNGTGKPLEGAQIKPQSIVTMDVNVDMTTPQATRSL